MFTEERDTFVGHFLSEHRRLHKQLASARSNLQKSDTPLSAIVQQLHDLRRELAHHFAEEEDGGCMEEAVVLVPRLAEELERLKREHVLLLSRLEELIQRCEAITDSTSRTCFCQEFEQFLSMLRRHEADENRLVQTGFNVDLELQNRSAK